MRTPRRGVFNTGHSHSLPCFNYYYDHLFLKRGWEKIASGPIPHNIDLLLTPQALAYWLMDDAHDESSLFWC
jgi:hypothetical protein